MDNSIVASLIAQLSEYSFSDIRIFIFSHIDKKLYGDEISGIYVRLRNPICKRTLRQALADPRRLFNVMAPPLI